MSAKVILLRVAQVLLVLFLFYYVASPLVRNAKAFSDTFLTLKPLCLCAGLLMLAFIISAYPFVWRYIVQGFGYELPLKTSIISWIYSNVGKYIPGKVWQFVGRVALTRKIKPEITLTTVFLEVIISSAAAIMVFFIRFFLRGNVSQLWLLYASLLFLVLLTLQHPSFIKFFLKFYARLRKVEMDLSRINLNLRRNLVVFVLYFVLWILTGVSFWVMIQGSSIRVSLLDSVTTYPISWILGYLTIIAPAGLGVRESILMTLLRGTYSGEVASAFSILTRVALVLGDFILFLFAFAFFEKGRPREK